MNWLTFVNEGIFSFIEGVIIFLLYTIIIDNRNFILENKIKAILFCLLYTGFSYWASVYLPVGYHTVTITVFLIFVLSYIVRTSIFSAIVIVAIISFIIAGSGYLVAIFEMLILNISVESIMNIPKLKLLHSFLVKLFQILLVFLLYKKKASIFNSDILKREKSLASIVFLQGFMMAIFIMSVNYIVGHENTSIVKYNALLYSIFLVLIVFAFIEAKERESLLKVQEKVKALEEHIKNMETMISIIRREKHDFSNHLNTIYAICTLNNPDATSKIHSYIGSLSDKIKESYHFYDTGNGYVDGLLAVKSSVAYEKGIKLQVENDEKLDSIDVNDSDLTSIIGNIVDNAFEALYDYDPPYSDNKIVSFYTSRDNGYMTISISNNGPKIPDNMKDKIFESGFSTKSEMRLDHGFGLFIVKQLVEKNKGQLFLNSNEYETEFVLKFKLKEKSDEKDSRKVG